MRWARPILLLCCLAMAAPSLGTESSTTQRVGATQNSSGLAQFFAGLAKLIGGLFGQRVGSGESQEAASTGHHYHDGERAIYREVPSMGDAFGPISQSGVEQAPTPSGRPAAPGIVEVWLPRDRCKHGWMYFGDLKCPVLGRGMASGGPPGTQLERGTMHDGSPCSYLPSHVRNGATPVADYRLKRRSGTTDENAQRWGGGPNFRMNKIPGREVNRNFPNRSDLVMHSDRNTGTPLDYRSTAGCIKIEQACQSAFGDYFKKHRSVEMRVREGVRPTNLIERSAWLKQIKKWWSNVSNAHASKTDSAKVPSCRSSKDPSERAMLLCKTAGAKDGASFERIKNFIQSLKDQAYTSESWQVLPRELALISQQIEKWSLEHESSIQPYHDFAQRLTGDFAHERIADKDAFLAFLVRSLPCLDGSNSSDLAIALISEFNLNPQKITALIINEQKQGSKRSREELYKGCAPSLQDAKASPYPIIDAATPHIMDGFREFGRPADLAPKMRKAKDSQKGAEAIYLFSKIKY